MNKVDIRNHILWKLNQLSVEEKQFIESALHKQLLNSVLWKNANIISMTYAKSFEWDTYPIMQKAWKQKKIVVLPKSEPATHQMYFYKVENIEQLKSGYVGIMEPDPEVCTLIPPQSIELVLVPGLAFDQDGYRIGFGGGYYDRFLARYNGKTISLVSQMQFVDQLPVDSYDIPVENIVTEKACYSIIKS